MKILLEQLERDYLEGKNLEEEKRHYTYNELKEKIDEEISKIFSFKEDILKKESPVLICEDNEYKLFDVIYKKDQKEEKIFTIQFYSYKCYLFFKCLDKKNEDFINRYYPSFNWTSSNNKDFIWRCENEREKYFTTEELIEKNPKTSTALFKDKSLIIKYNY